MVVQTTYSVNHRPLHAGQIADDTLFNTVSGLPATDIPYGFGVIRDGQNVKIPASANEVKQSFLGVAMYELNRASTLASDGKIPAGFDATIITEGHICVVISEAVAAGDAVYLTHTGADAGKFAKTDPDAQILDSWEFKTAGTTLAVIGLKSNVVLPIVTP